MAFEVYKPNQGVYARAIAGVGGGIMAVYGGYWMYSLLVELPLISSKLPSILGIELTWGLFGGAIVFGILGGTIALITTGADVGIKKLDGFTTSSVDFLMETETELKKVSWPSREELTGSTFVVIFVTIILGIYIVGVDWIVSTIMKHVIM